MNDFVFINNYGIQIPIKYIKIDDWIKEKVRKEMIEERMDFLCADEEVYEYNLYCKMVEAYEKEHNCTHEVNEIKTLDNLDRFIDIFNYRTLKEEVEGHSEYIVLRDEKDHYYKALVIIRDEDNSEISIVYLYDTYLYRKESTLQSFYPDELKKISSIV